MLGGLSSLKEVDTEIIDIVNSLKNNFENKNYKTELFDAISYKTQVVNGTNFFIKVQTDKEFVHLKVYKKIKQSEPLNISNLENEKSKDDEITYF